MSDNRYVERITPSYKKPNETFVQKHLPFKPSPPAVATIIPKQDYVLIIEHNGRTVILRDGDPAYAVTEGDNVRIRQVDMRAHTIPIEAEAVPCADRPLKFTLNGKITVQITNALRYLQMVKPFDLLSGELKNIIYNTAQQYRLPDYKKYRDDITQQIRNLQFDGGSYLRITNVTFRVSYGAAEAEHIRQLDEIDRQKQIELRKLRAQQAIDDAKRQHEEEQIKHQYEQWKQYDINYLKLLELQRNPDRLRDIRIEMESQMRDDRQAEIERFLQIVKAGLITPADMPPRVIEIFKKALDRNFGGTPMMIESGAQSQADANDEDAADQTNEARYGVSGDNAATLNTTPSGDILQPGLGTLGGSSGDFNNTTEPVHDFRSQPISSGADEAAVDNTPTPPPETNQPIEGSEEPSPVSDQYGIEEDEKDSYRD